MRRRRLQPPNASAAEAVAVAEVKAARRCEQKPAEALARAEASEAKAVAPTEQAVEADAAGRREIAAAQDPPMDAEAAARAEIAELTSLLTPVAVWCTPLGALWQRRAPLLSYNCGWTRLPPKSKSSVLDGFG